MAEGVTEQADEQTRMWRSPDPEDTEWSHTQRGTAQSPGPLPFLLPECHLHLLSLDVSRPGPAVEGPWRRRVRGGRGAGDGGLGGACPGPRPVTMMEAQEEWVTSIRLIN